MNKYQYILDIYQSFSPQEKVQLQAKRRIQEKKLGIRYLNLLSYINQLALDAGILDNDRQNTSDKASGC